MNFSILKNCVKLLYETVHDWLLLQFHQLYLRRSNQETPTSLDDYKSGIGTRKAFEEES